MYDLNRDNHEEIIKKLSLGTKQYLNLGMTLIKLFTL